MIRTALRQILNTRKVPVTAPHLAPSYYPPVLDPVVCMYGLITVENKNRSIHRSVKHKKVKHCIVKDSAQSNIAVLQTALTQTMH